MEYLTYKALHLFGAFFLLTALGGMTIAARHNDGQIRKLGSIAHGMSLLVLLVSGFGLLAKLGIHGIPGWAWIKLGVWLLLGGIVVLIKRWTEGRLMLWMIIPLLASIAAYLGVFHPPAA